MEKVNTGKLGETISANYLKNKGYQILALNFSNKTGRRLGEIDIIAREEKNQEIVFVEVKTRNSNEYDHSLPEENITRRKIQKLSRIANFYLKKNGLLNKVFRFDAISVWIDLKSRKAKVKHLKNIYL